MDLFLIKRTFSVASLLFDRSIHNKESKLNVPTWIVLIDDFFNFKYLKLLSPCNQISILI